MKRIMRELRIAAGASVVAAVGACNAVGPAALGNSRAAYNNIINQTEDEQILAAIVRLRYDQTFSLLAVTSITANISMRSSVDVEAEIGPGSSFEGSTFGAWVLYEENPTISYGPVGSEVIVERMLAPLSADQTLLLRTLVELRLDSEAKGQLAPVLTVPVGR